MQKKKRTSKEVIQRIKERNAEEEKANYTFRLNMQMMERFKAKCQAEDVSMASVLEELISDFC